RGQDHHRSLAAVLQHREATLVAWIQATGTRGHHLACASKRSSTVICPGNSPKADHELRLKPDHPMGSGQFEIQLPLIYPMLRDSYHREWLATWIRSQCRQHKFHLPENREVASGFNALCMSH